MTRRWLAPLLLALAPLLYLWRATGGQYLLAAGDVLIFALPQRVLAADLLLRGESPLWHPFAFSGYPAFAAAQGGMLHPASWLIFLLPPVAAINWQFLLACAFAAVGTWAYLRALGAAPVGAALAALSFAVGGFVVGHLDHLMVVLGVAGLPWLLWALERLRQTARWRYVAVAAVAVALSVFAGHLAVPVYLLLIAGVATGADALLSAPPGGRLRHLLRCAAAVALGLGLAGAQLLPSLELARHSQRVGLSYAFFVEYALPLLQTPMLLFPTLFGSPRDGYWGAWNPSEITLYVGLVPLMLAVAALAEARRNRHVVVWAAIAVLALLLALGDDGPLSRLAFHLPVYNLFRAPGRNLLGFNFAIVVLAALGASAARPRALRVGAGVVLAATAIGAAGAVFAGESLWAGLLQRTAGASAASRLAAMTSPTNPALLLPLATAVAAAAALIAVARRPTPRRWAIVLAVQALDLLAFTEAYDRAVPAAGVVTPPPLVERLLQAQRGDTGRRAALVVPHGHPSDMRLGMWGVRMVNGYDPFLLAHYAAFTGGMTLGGEMPAGLLVGEAPFLDLLDVGQLVVLEPADARTRRAGDAVLSHSGLDVWLQPGETIEFALPTALPVAAIAAVTTLGASPGVAQGTPVLRIALDGGAGGATLDWRAGVETAEWAWLRPDVQPIVRHGRATPYAPFRGSADWTGDLYLGRRALPAPVAAQRVRLTNVAPAGSVRLHALSLLAADRWLVLGSEHRLRAAGDRWQPLDGAPQVFANRRALGTAWLVPETRQLDSAALLAAVRTGVLPDGSRFDPRAVALVEEGLAQVFGTADPAARVEVVTRTATHLELASRSSQPGMLVVSEIDYPGWTATVDGAAVPIRRVNYALRGVPLPAGAHRVEFRFAPRSLAAGAVVSLLSAAVLVAGALRRAPPAAQPQGPRLPDGTPPATATPPPRTRRRAAGSSGR